MSFFDKAVTDHADRVINDAIRAVLAIRKHGAVLGVAPAGAGKSYAIGTAVLRARDEKMRLAVATPTNEQAYALVRDLARRTKETITLLHSKSRQPPPFAQRNVVTTYDTKTATSAEIVVGTLNKLGDAHARGSITGVDLLLVDEAYQANSVHYFGVGDLAPRHLLMGDSGQLAPFSTAPEGDRWRGLGEDPLLTAVEVLKLHHKPQEHKLPITRRLDPRALPVARSFYPDHEFRAAVLPGVRKLTLARGTGKRRDEDAVLDAGSKGGWAHVELPASAVVTADPETVEFIVSVVTRLFERKPTVECERDRKPRALLQSDVAVVVSHNDQKDALKVALERANLGDVVVATANKLQGLTYEVVVAWHPLAGLLETDEFHLDPGRLCVMLTRHRHACIVVGRAADRELVAGIPPATPSYVGWDMNPALDGWYAHEAVFEALAPHRIEARVP